MTKLGLKKGMTDLAVIDALTTGKGAFDGTGETSETVLDMFDRVEDQMEFEHRNTVKGASPSLQVASIDSKYAVLRHERRSYAGDADGWIYSAKIEQAEHYLAGISDEGKYFVRPLGDIAESRTTKPQSALDWLNRADQGFWRLQGDLVVKFMPYRKNRLPVAGQRRNAFLFRLGISAENGDAIEQMAEKNNDFSRPITYMRNGDFWPNSRRFGNHELIVEGWPEELIMSPAFTGNVIEPMIVEGAEIELHHPEHDTVYTEIPDNHYAVLASQRGGRPVTRATNRLRFAMGD